MEILLVWLIFAVIVGAGANGRGRSGFGWFLLAVLISPLLALILLVVLPNVRDEARRAQASATPFTPITRTPPEGLPSWASPDAASASAPVNGNVALEVVQRVDDWAHVRASNGWTGWVDGRRLVPLAPPPPPPPPPAVLAVETSAAYLDAARAPQTVAQSQAALQVGQRMRIKYKDSSKFSGVTGRVTSVGAADVVIRSEKTGQDVVVRFDNMADSEILQ